jgi:CubicO group peptidase (beta-lactamase class C family)
MRARILIVWILLVALLCCTFPPNLLAARSPQQGSLAVENQINASANGSSPLLQANGPVIASIEQVGDNAHETADFSLDECTAIRIYAVGEGSNQGMDDFGAIENTATGQVIWQMYYFETEPGGGGYYKNRLVDRAISLPAGTYRLHFWSNESHSFEDWGRWEPDDPFWGIALYEDLSGTYRGTCWERAERPEDLGWSSSKLQEIIPELERLNCSAFLIVTDGQIVFEWGNTANNFFAHSMRKSLVSGLYGIYVAEGKIDLSKTLAELGIDDKVPLTEEEKQATVNDLIKARSGVYIPAAGEAASMKEARPERGSHAPGTFWYYNNWDFNALGTIFDQETGEENLYQPFKRRIADPIGMQDLAVEYLRYTYEPQSMHPYYGFRISARDLARFGQLFLQEGQWQGQMIIPAEWVNESTQSYSETGSSGTYSGYGYMWWIAARDSWGIQKGSYAASGYGGHTLEVLPYMNTVIVFRVNTDDPEVRLIGGGAVDGLIMETLRASNRANDPYNNAQRFMLIWAALTAASLLVVLGGLLRSVQASWGFKLAWLLVTLVFGPLGLLAYLFSFRRLGRPPEEPASTWWTALAASLYSMAGYAIAWILVFAIFFYILPSRHPLITLLISYGLFFIVGLFVLRAPSLTSELGGSYAIALRRSGLAEVISSNLAFAGMFPVGVFLIDSWAPGNMEVLSPLFLGITLFVVTVGLVFVYPFNAWQAGRGFASWFGQPRAMPQEEAARIPAWKNARGALLLSIAVFVLSIVLTAVMAT